MKKIQDAYTLVKDHKLNRIKYLFAINVWCILLCFFIIGCTNDEFIGYYKSETKVEGVSIHGFKVATDYSLDENWYKIFWATSYLGGDYGIATISDEGDKYTMVGSLSDGYPIVGEFYKEKKYWLIKSAPHLDAPTKFYLTEE